MSFSATAIANPNIAFIKYWGNCEPGARIPANGSISMNLGGLETRTSVIFDPILGADHLLLNGVQVHGEALGRVVAFMDRVRRLSGLHQYALIESHNNFPTGTGIASSASGFAALALSTSRAAGLELDEAALSRLARVGSGSACRSIPGGYVEWLADGCDPDSGAVSIAPPEHWDLRDCVAIVERGHKLVGSAEGHILAHTSPLQDARVDGAPQRLKTCRDAILARDFGTLARVVELDSHLMHAVMMTSNPPLFYWRPTTLAIMQSVRDWRHEGLEAFYTIDAGPNVHVICEAKDQETVSAGLQEIEGVEEVVTAHPGGSARLLEEAVQ